MILTIDQAFNDENFPILEQELKALNVSDSKFMEEVKKHVKSPESVLNFVDLQEPHDV